MTLSQGWIAVAQKCRCGPDPARTGFTWRPRGHVPLCLLDVSQISSAMLGGVASIERRHLVGVGMEWVWPQ